MGSAEDHDTSHPATSISSPVKAYSWYPCEGGFYTNTNVLTPPDDSTADNTPAVSVNVTRSCAGPATLSFQTEIYATNGVGSYIHTAARATCVSGGGFGGHCSPGTVVYAQPGAGGHAYTFNGSAGGNLTDTNGFIWVFPYQKRGVWKYEVEVGGDGVSSIQYRSAMVQTYQRG